jgi:hypothetical protein
MLRRAQRAFKRKVRRRWMRARNAWLPAPRVKRKNLPRFSSILMVVPFRQEKVQYGGFRAERNAAVVFAGQRRNREGFHAAMVGPLRCRLVAPRARRITAET